MSFFDTEQEFEIIPEGFYAAKLEDVTLDETKAEPKLKLKYKLSNGRYSWQTFTFKDSTKKWISWQIGVIGAWSNAKVMCTDPTNMSLVARACLDAVGKFIGHYYEAEISHREYNGKTYTDLKLDRELTMAEAKEFTKASVKTETAKPAPKVSEPPAFNTNDNELPF